MTTTKHFAAAALAGLLTAGLMIPASASAETTPAEKMANDHVAEKHACKGQNSCKGKGGCKSADNACKGHNACKGKGSCATDGSKTK